MPVDSSIKTMGRVPLVSTSRKGSQLPFAFRTRSAITVAPVLLYDVFTAA